MNKFGFVRVAAVSPELKVADVEFNTNEIIKFIDVAADKSCEFVLFPELCITGYTCADLFFQNQLLVEALDGLERIRKFTIDLDIVVIVGVPICKNDRLYNCAAVIYKGKVLELIPKTYLPNRGEFYEERWFTSDSKPVLFVKNINNNLDCTFGIEICEDLWAPIPPSSILTTFGASLIFNLSASNQIIGKSEYREELVKQQSARTISAYVYASAGASESTTDIVFSGHLMICENGSMLSETKQLTLETKIIWQDIDIEKLQLDRLKSSSFAKSNRGNCKVIQLPKHYQSLHFGKQIKNEFILTRHITKHPFVPTDSAVRSQRCAEILEIQSIALARRLQHIKCQNVVLGLSGGLDSTLALIVCVKALRKLQLSSSQKISLANIVTLSMPGFGTSNETKQNALELAKCMKVTHIEIPIGNAVSSHLHDINHSGQPDITYENSQARERTQILMDMANKLNAIVIGTGDLSELAIGWCTYNGDHMSMYNVNASVPKTLVKFLVQWYSENVDDDDTRKVLEKIYFTPISPELLPLVDGVIAQKTEDKIGPFELHDFFLFNFLRNGYEPEKILYLANKVFHQDYDPVSIKKWLIVFYKRFFANQFKRSAAPDGPKIGSVTLSPRGDWRMPSDAIVNIWLNKLETND